MKIFLNFQKEAAIIGFVPHQHAINARTSLPLFIDTIAIFLSCAYFFIVANTFQEYAESIFFATEIICITIAYAITVSRMPLFFSWLNEAEQIIDESEFERF